MFRIIFFVTVLLATRAAHASIVLSIVPASQEVAFGGTVSVDVLISGLTSGAAPSLGAFDLDIDYNPAILNPTTVVLGNQLDLSVSGSIQFVSLVGPVNISEISLESAADLNNLQLGEFPLATLTFDTLGIGTSLVSVANVMLTDANGNPLQFDNSSTGTVTVTPEPATIVIWSLLVLVGAGLRRDRKLKTAGRMQVLTLCRCRRRRAT